MGPIPVDHSAGVDDTATACLSEPSMYTDAQALATLLLDAEDPKEFLRQYAQNPFAVERAKAKASHQKFPEDYELENIGITGSQYFQGRGTHGWDDVFVGAADNPKESIEDALESAAMSGWYISHIPVDDWPEEPSATETARAELGLGEDDDLPDIDTYYYTAIYLREKSELEEAEDPKEFLRQYAQGVKAAPSTWPVIEKGRWKRADWGGGQYRRAWRTTQHQRYMGRDPQDEPIFEPYTQRINLRNTHFYRNREKGEYWIKFHNTNILHWDRHKNLFVDTGGYLTMTTKERVNGFLPRNWRIWSFHGGWYWVNLDWPENIRTRLSADMSARRKPYFAWWIPYNRNDYISPDGVLHFGKGSHNREMAMADKQGWARPDGTLSKPGQPVFNPPAAVDLGPQRRRRERNDRRQLHLALEGHYIEQLARWKRIKAKHKKMAEVKKAKRELEKVDEPQEHKRKDGHENLR